MSGSDPQNEEEVQRAHSRRLWEKGAVSDSVGPSVEGSHSLWMSETHPDLCLCPARTPQDRTVCVHLRSVKPHLGLQTDE